MDQARADMIKRVTMDWPVTLQDWDVRDGVDAMHNQHYWQSAGGDAWVDRMPEPVSAIVFAQEHGCTEILPAAFYRLATIDIDADWGEPYYHDPGRRARWALCDKDNLVHWIRGRNALESYHHFVQLALSGGKMLARDCILWWIIDPPDPRDSDEPFERDMENYPCLDFLWTLRDMVWGTRPSYNPLRKLTKLDPHDCDTLDMLKNTCPKGLCRECHGELKSWIRGERDRVWKRLPDFFRLQ